MIVIDNCQKLNDQVRDLKSLVQISAENDWYQEFFKNSYTEVNPVLTFHIGSCYNLPTILLEARLRLVGQPFCQHLHELGLKVFFSWKIVWWNVNIFVGAELKS